MACKTPAFVTVMLPWRKVRPTRLCWSSTQPTRRVVFTPVRACSEVSRTEVENVAKLAQLHLSEQEVIKITPEVEKVIRFFDTISDVNVEGVEPMTSAQDLHNIMRDDTPVSFPHVDDIIAQVPSAERDYVRVPKVSSENTD